MDRIIFEGMTWKQLQEDKNTLSRYHLFNKKRNSDWKKRQAEKYFEAKRLTNQVISKESDWLENEEIIPKKTGRPKKIVQEKIKILKPKIEPIVGPVKMKKIKQSEYGYTIIGQGGMYV